MVRSKKQPKLRKDLGLTEVFCIASGAMISSGLFVLPGIAYAKTGSSVVLSYLLASFLMLPTLFSKAELTTAMPKAGGDYFFIDRSMGPALGTIGGFASWFSITSKTAFALIGIGAFVQLFNPGLGEIELKLIAISFCLLFTAINLIGVKHSGRTQVFLVVGLIGLLLFYIIVGFFFIDSSRFQPFAPFGVGAIFSTAGLIFISYMGLTKVCSVAEEIHNPKRNIPLGMVLAWSFMTILYGLVVFVTVGLLSHQTLSSTLMPIALGAKVFLGDIGLIAMAIAAILAFVTTANAGLLSASRYPLAMSKDHLLPAVMSKMSKNATPVISLLFTSTVMILIISFLDLEGLVKMASTLVLLLFIFVNFSIIIMRESNIRHYRPSFRSPFYPWVQILGITGNAMLIIGMGLVMFTLVGIFILFGFAWYYFYARDKIWREYTLLHLIERMTGQKRSGYLVDEELREILINRDNVTEKRFGESIQRAEVIDLYKYLSPDEFAKVLSEKLSKRIGCTEERLYNQIKKRQKGSHILIHPGIAIFSHIVRKKNTFEIIIIRSKKGMMVSEDIDPIHAFFAIVSSKDQRSFHLHSLMWFIQISENIDFEKEWMSARKTEDIKRLILDSWALTQYK
jgi:basic amino acid/polyamine antiporter, APA family